MYFLDVFQEEKKKEFIDFLKSCKIKAIDSHQWNIYKITNLPSGLGLSDDPLIVQFNKEKEYIRYNVWELEFEDTEDFLACRLIFKDVICLNKIPKQIKYTYTCAGIEQHIFALIEKSDWKSPFKFLFVDRCIPGNISC